MTEVFCPYCCADLYINHDDGFGYQENVKHQMRCKSCGKYFVFETTITFNYYSSKAKCLNGGDHDWQPTYTCPKEYTMMQCLDCDEQRHPTEEEKILNHIPSLK